MNVIQKKGIYVINTLLYISTYTYLTGGCNGAMNPVYLEPPFIKKKNSTAIGERFGECNGPTSVGKFSAA